MVELQYSSYYWCFTWLSSEYCEHGHPPPTHQSFQNKSLSDSVAGTLTARPDDDEETVAWWQGGDRRHSYSDYHLSMSFTSARLVVSYSHQNCSPMLHAAQSMQSVKPDWINTSAFHHEQSHTVEERVRFLLLMWFGFTCRDFSLSACLKCDS